MPYSCKDHYPTPDLGYLAFFKWAGKMNKTHMQKKCRECGLYKIWVPRHKGIKQNLVLGKFVSGNGRNGQ